MTESRGEKKGRRENPPEAPDDPGDQSAADAEALAPLRVTFADQAWTALDLNAEASETEHDAVSRIREETAERLLAILAAERLVVLTGLGTSLGIKADDGTRPAPTMADLWDAAAELDDFEVAKALVPEAEERKDIELLLSRCQFALALGQDDGLGDFLKGAEAEILRRCQFVTNEVSLPTHELFLRKVARRSVRLPRTQLFTTNYDLAFERAADVAGFHLVDGFRLGEPRRFDGSAFDLDFVRRRVGERPIFEPNVAQLLKLHGSVDWDGVEGDIVRTPEPANPVLIYPAHSKFQLSYERPYLECMARFQMALREPDVALVVIGFGFQDEHLAAPIRAAVQSNVGLRLAVVTPSAHETSNRHLAYLSELILRGDRRITLLATDFDRFTGLLPEIAPRDEREVHEQRLRETSSVIEA